MKKPVVDYRTFRLRKINEPQLAMLPTDWQTVTISALTVCL